MTQWVRIQPKDGWFIDVMLATVFEQNTAAIVRRLGLPGWPE